MPLPPAPVILAMSHILDESSTFDQNISKDEKVRSEREAFLEAIPKSIQYGFYAIACAACLGIALLALIRMTQCL